MKKLLFFLVVVTMSLFVSAQSVVFHEDFELPLGGDSLLTTADSAGFPTTNFIPWSLSSHLFKSGVRSDSNRVQNGKTIYLTSLPFSTIGNTYVILEFAQICKLYISDGGQIEVSINGGTSWTTLGNAQYMGTGVMSLSKFSENSYSTDWGPGDTLIKPTNSWWRNEKFDISSIAANQSNVKIRFKFYGSGSPIAAGRYGWLLDDVKVIASPSELTPPVITMVSNPIDTIYSAGPYTISAYVKDNTGIDTVFAMYKVGNGSFMQLGLTKSPTIDSLYSASIPFQGWGKKILYNITARDASTAHNIANKPISGYYSFFVKYSNGGTVIIGTGTTQNATNTYPSPYGLYYSGTKEQFLIRASELQALGVAGGSISSIGFDVVTPTPATTSGGAPSGSHMLNFNLSVGYTSSAALATPFLTGLTQVYSNPHLIDVTGWNMHNFTTPILWDGTNNIVIETCYDNYVTASDYSSNAIMNQSLTSFVSTLHYNSDQGSVCTTGGTASTFSQRPNIKITVLGASSLTQDAGIAQITSPTGGVTAGQPFNLEARIKNYGTVNLAKASIRYSVDGGAPATYAWTGAVSLNTDSVSTPFIITSLNLLVGPHAIKVWSELPNDSADQNSINDTAYVNFFACASQLSGSYTIGGTGANFATFAEALVGLTQCGINGAVTFNVAPGNYPEQLTIPEISGASATNTVTFKSANNDSTSVVLNYTSLAAANWIVKLNGADYITFKNIKFAPADSANSRAVVITNGATFNNFTGNYFVGYYGTGDNLALINIEAGANTYNIIKGNRIEKGSRAVNIIGTSALPLEFVTINNNVALDQQVYGIYAQYINNVNIDSNTVISSFANTNKYGIYVQYANHFNRITKNTVNLTGGTNMYGILTENSVAADSSKGLISNNMVSLLNGTAFTYGIRLITSSKYKVYFNSVVTNGNNSTDTRALNLVSSCSRIELMNNNLQSNKYPLYVEGSSDTISNYNNLYSTGSNLAYWGATSYSTLATLKAASLKDSNSVNINPLFNSLTNLHTFNGLLKGIGKYLSDVTTDIDGTPRLNPPCIGADEFIPPPDDAALLAILKPIGGCGVTATEDIKVVIKNVGTAIILPNTMTARYKIDSLNAVVSELVNRTMNPGDTIHFTFTVKANLAVGNVTFNDTTYKILTWVDLNGDFAHANDTSVTSIISMYLPQAPTANNVSIPYASPAHLAAVSNRPLFWYDSPVSTTVLANGSTYTTPVLYLTDTFYVEAKTSQNLSATIGTGTSTQTYPFYTNWGYTRSASLYQSSEIGGFGAINQLQWKVTTSSTLNVPIKIYLKTTSSASMTSDTWANLINGATLVYDGTKQFGTTGWFPLNLTSVYNYSSNNLMVLCEANVGGGGASPIPYFEYTTTTTSGSHQYQYNDNTPPTTALTLNTSRPNIKIIGNIAGCTSPRVPVIVTVAPQPPYEPSLTKVSVPNQGCGLEMEAVTIRVKNLGTATLSSGLSATYKINNGAFIASEAISTPIPAGDSINFTFSTLANLSAHVQSEMYKITAALVFNNPNNNPNNDTLALDSISSTYTPLAPVTQNVSIPYANPAVLTATSNDTLIWYSSLTSPTALYEGMFYTTPILYMNTTYYVAARAGAPNVKITEVTHYRTGTGQTNPYPAWCTGQDLIEISNLGGAPANLTGWNMEIVGVGARTFTIPNTILGGGQVLVLHVGPGTDDPANRYFNMGGTSDVIQSNSLTGFILKNSTGLLIDAAASNGYTFTSGGVTTADWSGNLPSSSGLAGIIRTISDNNLASDWTISSATNMQTIGTINPQLAAGGTGTGCISQRAAITVNVGPPPQNDAGVLSVVSPVGSVLSNTSTPVQFKVKNYGLATLNTVKARYNLNGILKPEYTATALGLLPGDSTVITLGNASYPAGAYNIKAWTLSPNNILDSVPYNDTATVAFNACYSGVYTIGDTVGGNPNNYNFPNFTSAVNAISVAGMCSNVTFNVAPGTYTEQVTIPNIPGSGQGSVLTFKAANNDSTSVILQYVASLSTANYTVKLNGSNNIVFNKITIKANGTVYGRVVELANNAKYNTISNCIIQMPTTTSSNYAGIYANGTGLNFNKILNNNIVNGYYGIYYYGVVAPNQNKGIVIEGNSIKDFYYYGIYGYYQDSILINKNNINTTSATAYGMYLGYFAKNTTVLKNKINVNVTTGSGYGLYLNYCSGDTTKSVLVANNFISITGGTASSTAYGLYPYYSDRIEMYYNNVNITVPNTSSRAMYQTGGTFNSFVNNIFANNGGGYAYYVGTTTAVNISNYNDFFTTGTNLAYWSANRVNLVALKTASNKDTNSLSINPMYISPGDLHLQTTLLAQKATPIAGITDDIDGNVRNVTHPTIGAQEIQLIPYDAGVTFIAQPLAVETEGASIPVKVAIMNFGTTTITSLPIYYKVNSATPVLFTYTLPIAPLGTDTVYLPNLIVPAGYDTIIAYTALTGDINTFNDKSSKTFFGIPLNDAQLVKILPFAQGCGLTTDTVVVLVKNKGINPIANGFLLHYQRVGDANFTTEPVSALINPGDSMYYAFNTQVDLSVTSIDIDYQIKAWVELVDDNIHYNDTAYKNAKSLHTPLEPLVNNVSIPYATNANLLATSPTNDPLYWYDTLVGGTSIFNGGNYITPYLYATDTFYVEARTGQSFASTVGTGTANQTYPFYCYWGYTRSASLYQASEIGGFGLMNQLQWNVATAAATAIPIKIYLKQVTSSSMTSDTWSNLINGATLVYDGTQTFNTVGWFPVNLSTPFNYLSGNLMVLCEANYGGGGTSPYPYFYYSTAATGSHQYQYQDTNPPTSALTINTSRPNIKLSGMVAGCSSQRLSAIVNVGPQSPKDAGVIEIVTPSTGVNLTNNEVITVKIKNFGSTAIHGFTMKYKVDNNTVVSQVITDTINANDILVKSFTQTTNLYSNTQPQTFVIKAWTMLTNDATALNDTTKKTVINNLPVYCPSSATSGSYEDLVNVTLGTINNTSLPTGNMYTDFTAVSPTNLQPGMTYPISIGTNFADGYSYQYGCWVNAFIDFNRDGVFDTTERAFASTTTSFNTVAGSVTVPFTAVPGLARMRVVFRESGTIDNTGPCGTYTWGETEDYTVNIIPPIPHDAGIAKMTNMGTYLPYYASNSQQPQFFIRNYGSDTLASAMVKINVNGTVIDHSWTPSNGIALQSLEMDSLIQNVTLQTGMNRIKAYTVLSGDTNYLNDTIHKKVFKEFAANPTYFDNFENNEYFYAIDTGDYGYPINNLWQQGVPKASIIPVTPSGTKVWATNLDTNYTANNTSYLYSPVFLINPMQADSLKFWQWRKMAAGASAQLEYKGTSNSWLPLGDTNDFNASNWYNDPTKVWKDSTAGWVKSTYKLSNLTNLGATIQFRFVFRAVNASPLKYGWAIDDFELTLLPLPADAGVINIINPTSTSSVGDTVIVKVTVKNFGTNPLSNIPVKYKASTGSAVATGNIVGPLAPGATVDYEFTTQKYAVGTVSYKICAYTNVIGDIYIFNDSTCKYVTVVPASNDVGIIEILEPVSIVNTGQVIYPKVVIKNFGTNPKTSIPLSYQRGTSTPVTGTWTRVTPLNLGDTAHYTFATPFTVPVGASFGFSAFTRDTTDVYSPNNKSNKQINICNVTAPSVIFGTSNPDFGQTGIQYYVDSVPNATSYTWSYSGTGVTIHNNGNDTITIDFANNSTNGQLSVTANSTICTSVPAIFAVTVGINEIDGSNFWLGQNMPNPTTGLTNIAYSLPNAGEVRFNIMNLYGQSVYSFRNVVDGGRHLIDLNVNDLAAGVYYYTIEFKGKRLVKKMVVNK